MNLYERLESELQTSIKALTYNNIKKLNSPQGPIIKIEDKEYYNMCSNNYLGFAADQITIQAATNSLEEFGVGPGAVRSISGSFSLHENFEARLAKFKHVESVLVVQSGFQANTSLLPTITTKDDLILSDSLNHASIIDATRLSKASRGVYQHCDMKDLREKLVQNSDIVGNIFIITDGVFSMDGDIAPLDEIYQLAKEFGCYTIVDDAHGEGVLGQGGRGAVDHFNLQGKIDIEIGTLSKAFGIVGGFIGGKAVLIDYLKQKARPFLFSSGLEQSMCAAGIAVVNELEKDTTRVKKLWQNAQYLQEKFIADGYSVGNTKTPITPFMVYDEKVATKLAGLLFERGILVSPIIFPTVAKGQARIRLMVSTLHETEQLDFVYKNVCECYESIK